MTARDDYDVIVVGGGPAGLSAATTLKALGVERVLLLERFEAAGGMPRHCGHPPFGMREFRRILSGPAYARRLVAEAERAGVEIRTRSSVLELKPGGVLEVATTEGIEHLTARRILIATGTREQSRAQLLAPGLRPLGVMNTAALQSFVYLDGRAPFARPVIIGSELVSLSALLTCRRHGIRPVALIEPDRAPRTRSLFMQLCRALRVPVHCGAQLLSIEGRTRVEALCLRKADGTEQRLECDGIVFSGRFTPEATLARQSALRIDPGTLGPDVDAEGRSCDPQVFVAGNVLHPVETAGHCWAEGRRIARRIAEDLSTDASIPQAGPRIKLGEGLRYVVPQSLARAEVDCVLNIRAEGTARGRLVLRNAAGQEVASRRVNSYPEQPLRLKVPARTGGLSGQELELRLEERG
ncbi:pyridine nucleotide-disulfide oxidoreductase [Salipiger sp. CCB-MM3]|uniref:NAD(P)/FAD-dependent oxidoreductase n=1 Tax=Salipiger sp. CCB-MM3 TaxID=1792508 RepID=UPI00080AB81A|nr:FAD-dependent oxidoreductase [Salipiger sp. CCB-MM3]ANT60833.1 pyridine nucleotide-disulfide oxidoreductase [Salipiger sp. CCB-MM3]